jgi:hypothetical protein
MVAQEKNIMVQRSEMTVGRVVCIRVQGEIHRTQGVVVALLSSMLLREDGPLVEHKCRESERGSADQQNGSVRVDLRLESLLA